MYLITRHVETPKAKATVVASTTVQTTGPVTLPFELVVSGGPKQEFIGGFKKQADYVNKYPVYRRENTAAPAGSSERFLYLYLRDAQQKLWALQSAAPDPTKKADATGKGEKPWIANWNPAGIRINPVYAMFIKGTFNAKSTRYEERGFNFPAGKDIFIVELYSDTVEGTVYIQDPRGGTVARTQPDNNKGKLKARFEGPLSGLGARIEIVASRRSMGDYLVVVRVKQ